MPRHVSSFKTNLIAPNDGQNSGYTGVTTNDPDAYEDAPQIRAAEQNQNEIVHYATDRLGLSRMEIDEFEVEDAPERPKKMWQKTTSMPCWLLVILTNVLIILITATFVVVFIFNELKVTYGKSCLTNDQCNSYVGLKCTAGKCLCGSTEFWSGQKCESQRTFRRSCKSQDQCDTLAQLLCLNVTAGSAIDSICTCSNYRYWSGSQCIILKTFNETSSLDNECDFNRNLKSINGRCDCNSTQFWNNMNCENKRTHNDPCFTTYWCNNASQGLVCSTTLPRSGTCDCPNNYYWWSANKTCLPELSMNATCISDYQCSSNQSLSCATYTSPPTCQCAANYWFNTTRCTKKFSSGTICNNSLQCDNTRSLTCNVTAQRCSCNESRYIWDGEDCVIRRTIGGACSTDSDCLSYQNLVCPTSGPWTGNCACPTNYYWNTSTSMCVIKKLWMQSCVSSYECYDAGFLSCQPNALLNRTVCDCSNYTHYWTGFLNNTYSGFCTPKINYGVSSFSCVSSYQCRDYNYISCLSNQCTCNFTGQYWDGTMCSPRLNYSFPCNSTSMCRNWAGGPNLQCLVAPGGSVQQCLCTPTQYFDYCADTCYTARAWQQSCNTSTCYATSNMCDQSKSLTCINNICNCTITQWWNGTSCMPKGTYLASCTTNQNFQCQDYNLLSCVSSQCQCGSTMYWSTTSNQCLLKKTNGGTCASTNECITAAGVGLSCISGTCRCSSGFTWNSVNQQCDAVG